MMCLLIRDVLRHCSIVHVKYERVNTRRSPRILSDCGMTPRCL